MKKRGVHGGFLTLAAALIEQAKKDLKSKDSYSALRAAKYFFLEPTERDSDDLETFAGLCAAVQINNQAAAKAIFSELPPHQRRHIYRLLQDAGYKTTSEEPYGFTS